MNPADDKTQTPAGSYHGAWRHLLRLVMHQPARYLLVCLIRMIIFCITMQVSMLITREFFNVLTGNSQVNISLWTLAGLLMGIALVRSMFIFADITLETRFGFNVTTVLRRNIFEHILSRPAVNALHTSAGEALVPFRDDAAELANFLEQLPFLFSFAAFAVVAVIIMLRINIIVMCIVFLPLLLVILAVKAGIHRVIKYRQESRKAAGAVTGCLGEMFGAVQAVKVAGAEERIISHFRDLCEARRKVTVRDNVFSLFINSAYWMILTIVNGILLLVTAGLLKEGSFTIGDFTLFSGYLYFANEFINQIGTFWAWYKQVGVSVRRMQNLMEEASENALTHKTETHMQGGLPVVPFIRKSDAHKLEVLEAQGLTYLFPASGRGISDISLRLRKGSFTVITGRIGSGKSTLLRVLLGLLPAADAQIRWNNAPVSDPASFFTPPRSAYTAQLPQLFQESVRDNILMGLPEDQVDMTSAIQCAVLESDIAAFASGLDTMIGAKGVKVSGGQRQRIAAARMFVRDPELLVFDDLSSALDVNTEKNLWEQVAAQRHAACLVVSHRKAVLRMADNIIVLKEGRMIAEGKLDDLLVNCEEMQHLWQGDIR